MKRIRFFLRGTAGAVWLCLASGCVTLLGEDPTPQIARERENILLLREELHKTAGRLEALEMEQQRLQATVEETRKRQTGAAEQQARQALERVDGLERRLAQLDAARERDKKEIVDALSARMAQILQGAGGGATSRSRPAARPAGPGEQTHTIRGGESLSSIAARYGVRVSALMEANGLNSADHIRAGDTLIIPAR